MSPRIKYTFKDVKKIVEDSNYELLSLEEEIINDKGFIYVSTKIKIWCKNPNHNVSTPTLQSFLSGTRCRQCGNENKEYNRKRTYQEVKDYIESFDYVLLSKNEEYKNNKTMLETICPNGHKYKTNFNRFKNGQRCGCECGNLRLTYEEVKRYIESFGYKLLSTEYKNNHDNLLVQCSNNHQPYTVRWNNFKSGSRCPHCNEFKGEEKISSCLQNKNVNFIRQYGFNDCRGKIKELPFDFYLPNYNCCIEYDGKQHSKYGCFNMDLLDLMNRHYLDDIKTKYCKDNNINLIRISYKEFDNIEEIINNFII